MTRSHSITPRERLGVLAVALTVLVCWILTFRAYGHDWGGDFSLYIAHARNIAQGRPYAAVNYIPESIVEKDIPPQGPATYPPVFPLVLAPAVALYGLDYGALRAVVQALWLLSGILFYVYARRNGMGAVASAATVAVVLLSSIVLAIKDSVLSESTYLVISAAALIYFDSLYRSEAIRRPQLAGCVAGLLLLGAYLTRAPGIALVAAFFLHELYRARRIRAFGVAAALTFVAGFLWYRLTLYDGGGYSGQFRITPLTWARNVAEYLKSPAQMWGGMPAVLRYPAALLTLALAAAGLARRVMRGPSVAEFYVVLYMIPLILYSSGANIRYIVPVYPLLLLYCAESVRWAAGAMPAGFRRPALAALAVFLIVGATANVVVAARMAAPEGPHLATFQEAAEWLKAHVSPDEVTVTWNPRVVALYTERPSAYYRPVSDPGAFAARLDEVKTKWLLVFERSESDAQWLKPYMMQHPQQFTRVWGNSDFTVYQVQRDAGR